MRKRAENARTEGGRTSISNIIIMDRIEEKNPFPHEDSFRRLLSVCRSVFAHVHLLRLIIIIIINSLVAFLRRRRVVHIHQHSSTATNIILVCGCTILAMELINKFAVILPK